MSSRSAQRTRTSEAELQEVKALLRQKYSRVLSKFGEYGSYHRSIGNRIAHIICIPLILWSLFGMLESYNSSSSSDHKPASTIFGLHLTYTSLALLHTIPFIFADAKAGVATLGMETVALYLAQRANLHYKFFAFLVFNLSAWGVQFLTHAVVERERPALLNNLFSALNAPFYVVLEVMFFLGYKPLLSSLCAEKAQELYDKRYPENTRKRR